MKILIDVSNDNVLIHGEPVKTIEIVKEKLLGETSPVQPKEPEEKRELLAYNLMDGGRWVMELHIILEEK